MTNEEFSNEFDVLYNSITSSQAPGLDEYEKSVFLTKAQDEVIKSYFNPKLNKSQEGFDGNEKRQIDFSMIMRSCIYTLGEASFYIMEEFMDIFKPEYTSAVEDVPNQVPELEKDTKIIISFNDLKSYIHVVTVQGRQYPLIRKEVYDILPKSGFTISATEADITMPGNAIRKGTLLTAKNSYYQGIFDNRFNTKSIIIPNDIMMFINEYVEVERDSSTSRLVVLPINYIEYSRLMSKPYKRPLKNQAWRILDNSTGYNKAEIVIGPNDTLSKYAIRYIKKPNAIILCNLEGVTLDDKSEKQDCELDPILHSEVLQRAVELAKAAYTGNLGDQITLGQASQTNIGAVQSSR